MQPLIFRHFRRFCRFVALSACVAGFALGAVAGRAGALEDYVQRPDASFRWRTLETMPVEGDTVTHVGLISQTWRETVWTNFLYIVRPLQLRNPGIACLFVTAEAGTNNLAGARLAAERAGAWAVVLTRVPNTPLCDGRNADALIAYTFDQYLKTGDETWPLLLPMVKSAVRAMDVVQAWALSAHQPKIEKFVVTGASKRGWTTWLTAAVDARVRGIAPMVFDMLNLKAQTDWAQKVYGRQSQAIHDYTDLGLVEKMDTPGMARLRAIVDPFSYCARYRMPKLLLLGTNDPYWTVDSLRHYWNDLPGPKLVFQSPNTGHNLGREALEGFAAFFQMIADGQELPRLAWQMTGADRAGVTVQFSRPAKAAALWSAFSPTRDFRGAKWTSRELPLPAGSSQVTAVVETPNAGYRAFLAELTFVSAGGHDYRLSTQVQVTPDDVRSVGGGNAREAD